MSSNEIKQRSENSRRSEEYVHRIADASERVHTPILTHDEIQELAAGAHVKFIDGETLQQQVRQNRKSKTG